MSDKTIDVADEGNESQTSAEDTLSDDAQPSSTDERRLVKQSLGHG